MTPDEKEELKTAVHGIIDRYLADPENFELDLGALELRIKLKGEKWGGVVDKPVAKFLLDLDKRLHDELQRVGVQLPKSNHGVVALRIEEGSMEAFLEYAKGIFAEFRKMKPYTQVLVLVTILGVFGVSMAPDIIEKLQEPGLRAAEQKERVELVKAVAAISENQRELQAPMRGLVKSMGKEDEIILPGSDSVLTKNEVKSTLAKATRSKTYSYYIDFPFIVQELSTKKPGEWEIGLAFGETSFRAKMMITEDEISELLRAFQEAHAAGSEISPDLQVTAEINDKGVRSAAVVGLGAPRPKAVSLGDAVAKELERAAAKNDDDEDEDEGE
jgi:hypothetical protein